MVSTLWSIIDSAAAVSVTTEVVIALTSGQDVAVSLAEVQRRYLAAWRSGASAIPAHHFGVRTVAGAFLA